jgi:hypothetical protein
VEGGRAPGDSVERGGFEIGRVDPAGAEFFAAHEALVEVYVGRI